MTGEYNMHLCEYHTIQLAIRELELKNYEISNKIFKNQNTTQEILDLLKEQNELQYKIFELKKYLRTLTPNQDIHCVRCKIAAI
jgi:hypothetical protein